MELRISVSYLYFTVVPFHPPRNSNCIYQVKMKNLLIIGKNSVIGSDRSDTIDSSRMHCFPIEFCEIFSIVYINYRLPIKFKQNLSDKARIREIVKWSYRSFSWLWQDSIIIAAFRTHFFWILLWISSYILSSNRPNSTDHKFLADVETVDDT